MFLEITQVKYIEQFIIQLDFNNGEQKTVDLEDILKGEIFEPLKSLSTFKNFSIPHNTIEWPNGADFAPEFLYKLANQQASKLKTTKYQD